MTDSFNLSYNITCMSKTDKLRAMVLAAGVGSRLAPISSIIPKPLVPIGGKPVMEHILNLLKTHGITDVISNTHYLADGIHNYFKDAKERLGTNIEFRNEKELSGVAGGIRVCKDFLEKGTACIIMGDALTDIDLSTVYKKHKEAVDKNNCLVTIAQMQVEDTSQFGVIVTNEEGRVTSFQEKPKKEDALSNWANTGIYFFEPEVYDFIPSAKEAPFYDVAKDLFPKLLAADKFVQAVAVHENTYWADIGNPEQYLTSMQDLAKGKIKLDFKPTISPKAEIHKSLILNGINEIGDSCIIEDNVTLDNCLLWDNVTIKSGSSLKNCILASGVVIENDSKLENEILISEKILNFA